MTFHPGNPYPPSNSHNNHKNTAIYVRISRDDGFENYETIETQKSLLLEFVKKNSIGKVVDIYEDDNISGSSFERPGLERLKLDIETGLIDIVVIKDLSRLGRNNAKTLMFLDYLEEKGVELITSDGRYQSLKESGIIGIESWINERYIKDISVKIRQTLRHKIEKGEYIGNAPYGYMKNPSSNNTLIIDPEKSQIVKNIFQLYLEGRSYKHIADHLNAAGIPSPGARKKQGSCWSPSTIMRILSNTVYIGDTIQGVSEKISYKSRKTRRLPSSSWVITRNTHEPIISREIFEKVARLRQQRRSGAGNNKGKIHIFKGLLFCGNCGSVLFARQRKNRPMGYCCSNYMKNGPTACSSHYIRESDLLKHILRLILDILSDEEAVSAAYSKLENDPFNPSKKYCEKLTDSQKKLDAFLRQQEILYFDRLEGKISIDLFNKVSRSLEEKISVCKKEIELCSERLAEIAGEGKNVHEQVFMRLRETLEKYLGAVDLKDYSGDEFLREVVVLVVERVEVC